MLTSVDTKMASTSLGPFRPGRSGSSSPSSSPPGGSGSSSPASVPGRSSPSSVPSSDERRRPVTFLGLPLEIRNRIYEHAMFRNWIEDSEWGGQSKPGVPEENLRLLCVSRQVYAEAIEVLHGTMFLGGNAALACEYLDWQSPWRIRKVRKLILSYECYQDCIFRMQNAAAINWEPIFNRLWQCWACPREVQVYHLYCHMRWEKWNVEFEGRNRLEGACKTRWDEKTDKFWKFLKKLRTVEKMVFMDRCPGYFVHQIARDNWWQEWRKRPIDDDCPNFQGTLINPTFPGEFDWTLHVHRLIEEGVDVDWMEYDPDDDSWRTPEADPANDADPTNDAERTMVVAKPNSAKPKSAKPKLTFFDLPPEVRRKIFDYACVLVEMEYWPYEPKRWHAGTEIIMASKRVYAEAIPSMYRTLRVYGYDNIQPLARLGAQGRLAHARRLQLYFSCYCNNEWDREGLRRTLSPEKRLSDKELERDLREWGTLPHPVDAERHRRTLKMWREAFAVLSAEPCRSNIRDFDITMYSCQRCRRDQETHFHLSPAECAELERQFLEGLVSLRPQMQHLRLAGDIPPSLPVRLFTEPLGGVRMDLKWIDEKIRTFMLHSLKAWRAECRPTRGSREAREYGEVWLNPVPHPNPYCDADPPAKFVLQANTTATGRWYERVAGACATQPDEKWGGLDWPWHDVLLRAERDALENLPPWPHLRDAWDYANLSRYEHESRESAVEEAARKARRAELEAQKAARRALAERHAWDAAGFDVILEYEYEDEAWSLELAKTAGVVPWQETPIWEED